MIPKYLVVLDNGKPYSLNVFSDEELLKELTEFYIQNKDSGCPFDVVVYDSQENDITESQFITEMVGDILNEYGE